MIVGRPLRFLGLIVGGWIAMRVTVLWWPLDGMGVEAVEASPLAAPIPAMAPFGRRPERSAAVQFSSAAIPQSRFIKVAFEKKAKAVQPQKKSAAPAIPKITEAAMIAGLPMPAPRRSAARDRTQSRFAGSFWLVARGGSGPAAGVFGAQLGGSQAGARLTYALDDRRRVALAMRISTPLGAGARDLALGLEWQPSRLPVRLIAEQRIAVNGGRGGPAVGLVGGFGPKRVAAGLMLEGYAQGGVIGRDDGEAFADGAARLAYPIVALGKVRFDLGAGAWAAAQKGVSRADLGPSLAVHLPLGPQPVRLSLDWRQRVAGNATPGSGLVLSIGADF